MKKILVIMLCAILVFAMPVVASAETDTVVADEQSEVVSENEIATEGENVAYEEALTEKIVSYVQDNFEEIIVIVFMAVVSLFESRVRGKMTGSIGTLNNNAITIANDSKKVVAEALEKVEGIANAFEGLLGEIRASEEEKKALKDALVKVESYLNTAKLANIEFANELAELLCLSNIPNAKKDELYRKHIEGVHKLEAEEVKSNDGTEA